MSEPTDFLATRAAYLGALDDVIALFRYRDAWRSENEQLANDIAELVVGLVADRDTARAEADALRAEVARLQTNPLAKMLHRIPATEASFELVYHPSDVGDPGWACVVAGYVDYGTLDAVIAAACERLGVDHG